MSLHGGDKSLVKPKLVFWLVPNLMVVGLVIMGGLLEKMFGPWLIIILEASLAYVCWVKFRDNCRFSFDQLRKELRRWSKYLILHPIVRFLPALLLSRYLVNYSSPSWAGFLQIINNALHPMTYFYPIVEELIFRVGVFRLLEGWSLEVFKEINTQHVIWASAWVFGAGHFANGMYTPYPLIIKIIPILYPTVIGLLYGAIYAKSRNISLTMAHHVWVNAIETPILRLIFAHLIY
ncbi:MAG TPA: hypothetical protein DDZ53_11730 [Firmicutes bacterium]|nr:hypothetical protein [Bacillota bacterium]